MTVGDCPDVNPCPNWLGKVGALAGPLWHFQKGALYGVRVLVGRQVAGPWLRVIDFIQSVAWSLYPWDVMGGVCACECAVREWWWCGFDVRHRPKPFEMLSPGLACSRPAPLFCIRGPHASRTQGTVDQGLGTPSSFFFFFFFVSFFGVPFLLFTRRCLSFRLPLNQDLRIFLAFAIRRASFPLLPFRLSLDYPPPPTPT